MTRKPPPPSVFALGPFPIEGAPPMDNLVLLLFCPEQGGWHTGVRRLDDRARGNRCQPFRTEPMLLHRVTKALRTSDLADIGRTQAAD